MRTSKFNAGHHQVIRKLLLGRNGVREKQMFGYPAFFVGSRMFACVYEEGLGLKLPAARVEAMLHRKNVTPFKPHGKPAMREWIHIRRTRSAAYTQDLPHLLASLSFVSSLPTKRRQ